jgi:multidrug resistance efflux pump
MIPYRMTPLFLSQASLVLPASGHFAALQANRIRTMSSVVALYQALSDAPDDQTRARLIAEAFESLEERFPRLPDMATQGHVRESELRLQKEIEQVRAELKADIEQLRAELKADIAQIRAELRETELRLQKEIEQVRGDVARMKIDLLKWLVPLMFGQVLAIAALVKLL